jgi:hypothetical protein
LGSTICIKCGSSIDPFSYCELCKEPLNFKCSSCGFVTEVKVHVDCVNANSLVTDDESIDNKDDSQNIAAKPQDPMQRDMAPSNKSSPTQDVKAIDREISDEKDIFHSENYPSYAISDIIGKSWYSFARLSADIFSLSSRLFSLYYEQFLQYENAWGYYWTKTYKSFNTFSQSNESYKTDAI